MPPKETSLFIPSLRAQLSPGTSTQVIESKDVANLRFLPPETLPSGTVYRSSSHPLRGGCLTERWHHPLTMDLKRARREPCRLKSIPCNAMRFRNRSFCDTATGRLAVI